jgi:hypothetical protein
MIDYRVLFQYLDQSGHDRYEFTTVLAHDAGEAESVISVMHAADYGFAIVQTVESNGAGTGYTNEDRIAAALNAAALREAHPLAD